MKNNNASQKLYVITGGPGAGKTTLLNEFSKNGFTTVSEEGRRIIKEQLNINGNGLPWVNKKLFAELMFEASVKTYRKMIQISDVKSIFFDRGILDTIGYLKLENMSVPEELETMASEMPYNKNVFILPPWKEIYENDLERKQTWEEAIHTFENMKEIYLQHEYNIIEVPKLTPEQRVRFILDTIYEK
ncbi:AAA family ATPase [Chryseobacterium sp. M5A1_1a]